MIVKSLPAYDLKNEVVDEKDESAKDKNLWRYLNVSETFDDELEILARLKGYCLDEGDMLDGLMRMNGDHSSRNFINFWLVKLSNCVEMGDQVVNVINNSVKFFEEEKNRLEKKIKKFRSSKLVTKADRDEYKEDKKSLSVVKSLLVEWKSKHYFSKSLVNKLKSANKVYSKRVKKQKYCKPSPHIFRIKRSQISSSKENNDIEDIKVIAAERQIKRKENRKKEWKNLITEGVTLAKDAEEVEKVDSSKKKVTSNSAKNETIENNPSDKKKLLLQRKLVSKKIMNLERKRWKHFGILIVW